MRARDFTALPFFWPAKGKKIHTRFLHKRFVNLNSNLIIGFGIKKNTKKDAQSNRNKTYKRENSSANNALTL